MHTISAMQSKVARTYLNWSQGELANAANVSLSTISSFENGFTPRRGSALQIRKALEDAGIEFIEGDGVKRRDDEIKVYKGFGSCDIFYNDLLQTAKSHDTDIYCIVKSQDVLMQACGIADCNDLEPFEILGQTTKVKCLVSEPSSSLIHIPTFEFRVIPSHYAGPTCYLGYGNKYAHIVQEGRNNFIYAVFHAALTAQSFRSHFLSLWNNASPLRDQQELRERPAKIAIRA